MTYRFLNAGKPIQKSPKAEYIDFMQHTVDEQFYNSPSWSTIQEETEFASGIYQNVDVRINTVVDIQTGERVGDDFRKLIFNSINHPVALGKMYKFGDNYWITVNVDEIKGFLSTRVTVRRCNNVLRWIDGNGAYHQAPCSIGYLIKENRDYSTAGSAMVVPSGIIDVLVQMTPATRKIKPNQRFLLGNSDHWTAYRVEGGGIRNFNNTKTLDNFSAGLIMFNVTVDFLNEQEDDLTNGIADANQFVYHLSLNQSLVTGNIGQTVQLEAMTTLNGETVSRPLMWASSDEDIAEVSAGGLVTLKGIGTATITCSIENNSLVSNTCNVNVVSTPVDNYQVMFTPNVNYILEGREQSWSVYLFENGVQQPEEFVFTLDANSVPDTNYIYTVTGTNSFKIHNYERFLTDVLEVTATSDTHTRTLSISLRGAW